MKAANPYLIFNGNALEAFTFYKSVFGRDFAVVLRFKDMGGAPGASARDLERIAHIALPLGRDGMLMASDTLPSHGQNAKVGSNRWSSSDSAGCGVQKAAGRGRRPSRWRIRTGSSLASVIHP